MDIRRNHQETGGEEEEKATLNTSRTRAAKARALKDYTATKKQVKKSIRRDKRRYVENLAKEAEEAAGQGIMRELYNTTKKLSNRFPQTDKPVRDKHSNTLKIIEEHLKRWAEQFKELLNRPASDTAPDRQPAETDLPISCDPLSKAEIRNAITALKNGKAAGPDSIPAEAIKQAQRQQSPYCTHCSRRFGRGRKHQLRGGRASLSSCQRKETSGTAETTEG